MKISNKSIIELTADEVKDIIRTAILQKSGDTYEFKESDIEFNIGQLTTNLNPMVEYPSAVCTGVTITATRKNN